MSKFLDKTGLDTFWAKIKSTFQTLGNLVTSWGSTPSDTKYPSEKLVKDSLQGKVDKETGKGLSTNDYTTTEKNKLAGIASGAEVNVQSDWNQTTTTADDYIKNKPTIPSGTQLVYDCGTGSTSTTDFDNALAAFNAGKWVIIHDSGNLPYYCVGSYSGPGLRFKVLASETSLLKVYTLNWTRGSVPSAGTQLEAALIGHTHSNYVPTSRTINGIALTDNINLSASDVGAVTASKSAVQGSGETSLVTRGEKYYWNNKQDTLPSTWSSVSGPTYGIALDEGGIDTSLKNISASTGSMTTDTYILVHDAIGESSHWYARKINKLWDWVQDKIAAVLRLYTRDNDTPYFDGLAANAVQATKATNANITRTADTTNGDKLQIGTGTAVNITNAGRANYADNAGSASSAGSATYATSAGKAYEDGNGTTLAPLVVQYQTGSFPDIFNQLEAAYSSKRRIFCKHGLTIAGSTDTVELKIPLSGVRFSSSGSIRTFEFATQLTQRTSSADNAGQTIAISANHLENGSYNWGIAFDWPYHADTADVAGTAGTADTATSATKATQDGDGNNIVDTYAPLSSVLRIGNDDGAGGKSYNLDTFTARGIHFLNINESTSTNAPGNGYYTIIVTANKLGNRIWQVALGYYVRVRRYTGSAWTAWQTLVTLN